MDDLAKAREEALEEAASLCEERSRDEQATKEHLLRMGADGEAVSAGQRALAAQDCAWKIRERKRGGQ